MFVILVYDINTKRVGKVLKTCRKYLVHVQKSVFEGDITESKLNKLKAELARIIDPNIDAICIYKTDYLPSLKKEVIGTVVDTGNIF